MTYVLPKWLLLFGFVVAVGLAGFREIGKLAQPGAPDGTSAFEFLFGGGREACPWYGLQALGLYGFTGQFANTIGAFADPVQRLVDLIKLFLPGGGDAERKIAIIIVGARIGDMETVGGLFFGGIPYERSAAIR